MGAPGNYRNGIHGAKWRPKRRAVAVLACDHGELKGNLTASLIAGKPLGRDMGDHASHMGPRHDPFSHVRYSTEWIRDAFDPPEREFQDSRMKIMVASAVDIEAMCEQLYYANKAKAGPAAMAIPAREATASSRWSAGSTPSRPGSPRTATGWRSPTPRPMPAGSSTPTSSRSFSASNSSIPSAPRTGLRSGRSPQSIL